MQILLSVVRSDELDYTDMRKQWVRANLWTLVYSPGTRKARIKAVLDA